MHRYSACLQEQLASGCMDSVPQLDTPSGRTMGDVSSMFIVYLLELYQCCVGFEPRTVFCHLSTGETGEWNSCFGKAMGFKEGRGGALNRIVSYTLKLGFESHTAGGNDAASVKELWPAAKRAAQGQMARAETWQKGGQGLPRQVIDTYDVLCGIRAPSLSSLNPSKASVFALHLAEGWHPARRGSTSKSTTRRPSAGSSICSP